MRRHNPSWRDSIHINPLPKQPPAPKATPTHADDGDGKPPKPPKTTHNTTPPDEPSKPKRPYINLSGVTPLAYDGPRRDPRAASESVFGRKTATELTIAPRDDPYKYFTGSDTGNIATADWLKTHGFSIRSAYRDPTPDTGKYPDAVNQDATVTVELKRVSSTTSILKRIRRGRLQSTNLVLDARDSTLTTDRVQEAIKQGLSQYGKHIDSILVIISESEALLWNT